MVVTRVPLGVQFDVSRIPNQSVSTLVNCYAEQSPGKAQAAVVMGYPGIEPYVSLGGTGRGQFVASDGAHYAVAGSTLYRIEELGGIGFATVLGTIPGVDRVEIDANRTQIAVAAEGRLFVWDTALSYFSEVIDPNFEGCSTLAVIGGFGLIGKPDSDRFFITAINDFKVIGALDYSTAESRADVLQAIRIVGGEPWFLGSESIEPWPLTGAANFPFERSGFSQDVGCVARDTARNVGPGLMWLGRDRQSGGLSVYRAASSYQPERISTHAVDRLLERANRPDLAYAYTWRVEGHTFYSLTCDAGTVVYDAVTNAWHQAASGLWPIGSEPPPGRFNSQAYIGTSNIVGDDTGRLSRLSFEANDDMGEPFVRETVTMPMGAIGRKVAVMAVELELEAGTGGLTLDPQVLLSVSRDGGHTWETPRAARTGLMGRYKTRVRWNRLGQGRDFAFRFRMSDAAPFRMTGAWADIEALNAP